MTSDVQSWIKNKLVGKRRRAAVAELRRLEKQHSKLTSRVVVSAARSRSSPLHHLFEWNDSIAAEKYRLEQAGALIRTVKVVIETPKLKPVEVRAYVSPIRGQGYVTIEKALSSKDSREQLLAQARGDMESFMRRYRTLKELSVVFRAISAVLKKTAKKSAA